MLGYRYRLIMLMFLVMIVVNSIQVLGDDTLPKIESVTCVNVQGSPYLNVLLILPTPGYNITYNHAYIDNNTLRLNITLEPPKQPVIQVITRKGISINLTVQPKTVIIYLNGKYSGVYYCNNSWESNKSPAEKTSTNTTSDLTDTHSASIQYDNPESGNNTMKTGLVAGLGIGVFLLGLLLYRKLI